MKEVTEWDDNPRMMWVWDKQPARMKKAKVIWIRNSKNTYPENTYPVIALDDKEHVENFAHCAEIKDEPQLMTNKQLSRWLREKPNREFMRNGCDFIHSYYSYNRADENKAVNDIILVREGDKDWQQPTIDLLEGKDE